MEAEVDALASLEERIRHTVDLVSALRAERDAAVDEALKLQQELDGLRTERKQVRVRIQKLLGQVEQISGPQ